MAVKAPIIVQQLETAARQLGSLKDERKVRRHYSSIEEFVLTYGHLFQGQPLPPRFRRGKLKLCFANSVRMAERHRKLVYVEGFAHGPLTKRRPVHHAWCVDGSGMVYDRTWGFDPGREYFGVPFKLPYVRRMLKLSGEYGILDRWEADDCVMFMEDPTRFLAR